jgi:hypothetical protein
MPPRNMSLTPMIQMKPTNVLIAGTFLVVANLASAQHCRNIDINKTSGFCTVPDPKLTPGEMDPTQACVSNTENALSVSAVLQQLSGAAKTRVESTRSQVQSRHIEHQRKSRRNPLILYRTSSICSQAMSSISISLSQNAVPKSGNLNCFTPEHCS